MAASQLSVSPAAKHRRSTFGFEPSFEKRWNSAAQLHVLQQKTPHRYQQSPVFARKVIHSKSDSGVPGRHRHHHRHHDRHAPRPHRKRVVSEGERSSCSSSSSDEKVHLLSSLPWKQSESHSSDEATSEAVVDHTVKRQIFNFSPSLPRRLDSRLQLEKERRERTNPASSFLPRQSSPLNCEMTSSLANPNYVPVGVGKTGYRGNLVIDLKAAFIPLPEEVTSPSNDPVTPLVCSAGFLPTSLEVIDESLPPPPSPHTLRRFLGLEVEPLPEEGLTEEDILRERIFTRRCSSSSESSSSTLT